MGQHGATREARGQHGATRGNTGGARATRGNTGQHGRRAGNTGQHGVTREARGQHGATRGNTGGARGIPSSAAAVACATTPHRWGKQRKRGIPSILRPLPCVVTLLVSGFAFGLRYTTPTGVRSTPGTRLAQSRRRRPPSNLGERATLWVDKHVCGPRDRKDGVPQGDGSDRFAKTTITVGVARSEQASARLRDKLRPMPEPRSRKAMILAGLHQPLNTGCE